MKYILTIVSLLFFNASFGQIIYNTIPINKQLIARNISTNLGTIIIDGFVEDSTSSYDSIYIKIYRDSVIYDTVSQNLNFNSNIALFNFNIPIVSELANYSLKIYSYKNGIDSLEKEIFDLVAGDVFIIQGQSNAVAMKKLGSANENINNFIRVFANGSSDTTNLLDNNFWYIAQGDGNQETNGNTGQWGLKLARMIIDSLNIPIAIFNGAYGSQTIDYFLASDNYKTSLNTNYARLYYRLNKTGLKNYVRAVFWSQGERDAGIGTSTLDYKNTFITLKNEWKNDYPSIEMIYIFQTKNGCDKTIDNLMYVKEAQRQLAFENSDISIMSTAAAIHYTDECHFQFIDGYELFATRIYPLIARDLYNISTSKEIEPPMITNAQLIDEYTFILETDATNLSIESIAEDFLLESNTSATITNIETSENEIIFRLSENPQNDATISYLGQYSGLGNFITNTMGIELVCFNKFPITNNLVNINSISDNPINVYPNPVKDLLHIEFPETVNNFEISLVNTLGKEILYNKFHTNKIEQNLSIPSGIYFLTIKNENKILYTTKIIKK